ncbi:tripartite tricarboxylate transporter substrate binding protein [Filobacillus milosensis]|uniref:Tripartite tricarboxylate transporter substrate binding protein n=1 Tax=Filobacillus milosensis TaxID=94137 RepID=A0A4Y8IU69_9BACI|nr:tripartite tricarboxylate transporter substrate binding protein [Filobacillus milosensis]TFB24476.1 tripartite tricarboxylate transporter substrate binding protein [Filobacillus milosensis]
MKKSKRLLTAALLSIITLSLVACGGGSQESVEDYPSQEIEMTIPWSPGGGSDIEGRLVADHASEHVGVDLVPVNVPGVGGTVGLEELSNKEANGYSIGQIHEGLLVSHHSDVTDINYDSFEPIASMSSSDQILAVSDDLGVDTLEEFVEYGQKNEIQFGGTVAGIPRVWVEQIGKELDIQYNLVGYEGIAEAIQALAGGHIDAAIVDYPSGNDFVESGDMKFIAIGTKERAERTPDLPTFVEKGYDLTMGINRGYVAPEGTPPEIIEKLEQALKETANDEDYIKAVEKVGASVNFMNTEEYKEYLDQQDQVISDVIEEISAE